MASFVAGSLCTEPGFLGSSRAGTVRQILFRGRGTGIWGNGRVESLVGQLGARLFQLDLKGRGVFYNFYRIFGCRGVLVINFVYQKEGVSAKFWLR